MLTALHIQDFVLIEQAELSFTKGLAVLTGETGAGKSILLDALGLAVGARADRGAVREGANQSVIIATFEAHADHPVWGLLDENGLSGDEDQIILRRIRGRDGRSRGFVNDQPVSINMLRVIGDTLIEIHGQHDGRGFLSAATHRETLDEFGSLQKNVMEVEAAWTEWRTAQALLNEKRDERNATLREADYLRHVFDTLSKLDPQPDEEKMLTDRRAVLMASDKVADELEKANSYFDQNDLEGGLSASLHSLERATRMLDAESSILSEAIEKLNGALDQISDAYALIDRARHDFGGDPGELDIVEERLFALRAESRKHGLAPDGLCAFFESISAALNEVDEGEASFARLKERVDASKAHYEKAANALTKKRRSAAKKLDRAVAQELTPLKLARARFKTQIETDTDQPSSVGYDRVEFMVTTNPGAPAGPLKSIASGGELSRFVLAMKAALAAKENRTVIIFDEVDAGIGGAVADAVGERLARLALDAQVLAVTHSPQVAARAVNHWLIDKTQAKAKTKTMVNALSYHERVEEIARMLSGAEVTDAARIAAEQLLAGANSEPAKQKQARSA